MCSSKKNEEIFINREKKVIVPAQRYFNILANGLASFPDVEVTCISALPISSSTSFKKVYFEECETVDGVDYIYLPFKNGKISRFLSIYKNTKKYVNKWINANKNDECYLLTDVSPWLCAIPARKVAAKKIPTIGCVTDLPLMQIKKGRLSIRSLINIITCYVSNSSMKKYDGHIILTEAMKHKVSSVRKPYIVAECMVDASKIPSFEANRFSGKRIFLYAGGIEKRYGIENLVNAFEKTENNDIELWIYGSGDYVSDLINPKKKLTKTFYKGCLSSNEIFEIEKKATFLVNPRPTCSDFTKYSFPSKTAEYMTAGRPVLSTKLPGIPDDYKNYILWFDDESEESFISKITDVLKMSDDEITSFGQKAYDFCVSNKNGEKQALRIIEFLKTNFKG